MIREEEERAGGLSSVIMKTLDGSKETSRAGDQNMVVAVVKGAKVAVGGAVLAIHKPCRITGRETRNDKRAKQRAASARGQAER